MTRAQSPGTLVGAAGLGLLSWILVDASRVSSTLRLNALLDEAAVALAGLAVAAACFTTAAVLLRRNSVDGHGR